ncbi:Hypothetical protein R9X50_00752500 [Acrodontium crateriforme]|uniref:Uncharacterized protein n=1 Tax=Acrodontium crateriforme TaxID=150365 RepID=A0AAQ3M9V4_9PEZI|nr:Hypothetical protein R9X50_00752500 [Acrodontium crateriforme]
MSSPEHNAVAQDEAHRTDLKRLRSDSRDDSTGPTCVLAEEPTLNPSAPLGRSPICLPPQLSEDIEPLVLATSSSSSSSSSSTRLTDPATAYNQHIFPVRPRRPNVERWLHDTNEERINTTTIEDECAHDSAEASPPPPKVRRVLKSVRIRVHWTCHECNTLFTRDATCHQCGHRRCARCIRSPVKRPEDREHARTPRVVVNQQDINTSREIRTFGDLNFSLASDLEVDPDTTPDEMNEPSPSINNNQPLQTPVDRHEPSRTTSKDKADDIRTDSKSNCNRLWCDIPFTPRSSPSCKYCVHNLCSTDAAMSSDTSNKQNTPPKKVLPRIFKRPKQCIRYTCHECNAFFMDRTVCANCDHRQCGQCPREPPRGTRSTVFLLRHSQYIEESWYPTSLLPNFRERPGIRTTS